VPLQEKVKVLTAAEGRARARAHLERVRAWTGPHRLRASRGEKHPVWDFLFDYYAFRPSALERWHPGPDEVVLDDAGVPVPKPAVPPARREFTRWLRDLLRRMEERPAFFGCHGLHEWAMVYRQPEGDVRHGGVPLRFPPAALAAVVEALPVRCTHFDAFRFFTAEARPLNRLRPERARVPELEQRGCLHANMDLYKWAFKLAPFAPSELIADCFELARDIRAVDMRASPYDLAALGFPAIRIETPEGRADYERRQRDFETRGVPLRSRLIALCEALLHSEGDASPRAAAASGHAQETHVSAL
jgi:hypothetical protein